MQSERCIKEKYLKGRQSGQGEIAIRLSVLPLISAIAGVKPECPQNLLCIQYWPYR